MKHVLTVDIGTTSAKVMLVSERGQVIRTQQSFYPTTFPSPGWAEQDPLLILNSLNGLVATCASGMEEAIETISLSSAMHSVMAVDAKGTALSPLILWSDMRSAAVAKRLRADSIAGELYTETGTPIHPMSPLCKLLWIRENNSKLFNAAFKFISIKEFVIWHWCNSWTVDHSIASATGMFDIHNLNWSKIALEMTGINSDRLSQPAAATQRVIIKDDVLRSLGLRKGTTVTMGASDGCLANLGSAATGTGDLAITIGTSGAVRMISAKASSDRAGRLFNYRLDESRFVSGGATNNGTIVIDWFMKNILHAKEPRMEDFIAQAMNAPGGSGGLLFLPFVFGERAPYHNPDLRGLFFGLAQHHSVNHMMRSVLEGICFEVRSLVEAVEQSVRPVNTILASGGFVRSKHWVQVLADVLGREIIVRDVNDASSLGAALIGFTSLGLDPVFQRGESEQTFVPDAQLTPNYNRLFSLFGRIAGKLDDEFSEIASIQTGA